MSDQADVGSRRSGALTKAGRKQLAIELSQWERLSAGVDLLLQRT